MGAQVILANKGALNIGLFACCHFPFGVWKKKTAHSRTLTHNPANVSSRRKFQFDFRAILSTFKQIAL
jgi:hypothetical protein